MNYQRRLEEIFNAHGKFYEIVENPSSIGYYLQLVRRQERTLFCLLSHPIVDKSALGIFLGDGAELYSENEQKNFFASVEKPFPPIGLFFSSLTIVDQNLLGNPYLLLPTGEGAKCMRLSSQDFVEVTRAEIVNFS